MSCEDQKIKEELQIRNRIARENLQAAKKGAIRRIRTYSGQEIKGPELMQQLGIDHLG